MIVTSPSMNSLPAALWRSIAEYTPREVGVGRISKSTQLAIREFFVQLHRQYRADAQIPRFMPRLPGESSAVVVLKTAQAIHRLQLPQSPIDIRPKTLTLILENQPPLFKECEHEPGQLYDLLDNACVASDVSTIQAILTYLDQLPFSLDTWRDLDHRNVLESLNNIVEKGCLPQIATMLVKISDGKEGDYLRHVRGNVLALAIRAENLEMVQQLSPIMQSEHAVDSLYLDNALFESHRAVDPKICQFLLRTGHKFSAQTMESCGVSRSSRLLHLVLGKVGRITNRFF